MAMPLTAPARAASLRPFHPQCRKMFSMTTMALSTSMPMPSMRPPMVTG